MKPAVLPEGSGNCRAISDSITRALREVGERELSHGQPMKRLGVLSGDLMLTPAP